MADTGVESPAPIEHREYTGAVPVKRLALGYNGEPGRPEVAFSSMFRLMATGGIYSTARDLLRFD
jgi:CubicO group peptidase (beta-lactamase class C family)